MFSTRLALVSHAGVRTGRERGVGHELLTRDYGVSLVPSRNGATFTRLVKPVPVPMTWLMWHAAVGVSRNMKNQG